MKNFYHILTINFHYHKIAYTLSVITTFCLFIVFHNSFQSTNNNNLLGVVTHSPKIEWTSTTTSFCDSLPTIFQKVIDLSPQSEFTYDLLRYPNGDYLTIGNLGTNDFDHEAFAIKFDSTGHIHWAKIVGVDAFSLPPSPGASMDIFESFEDAVMLEDSSVIISGQLVSYLQDVNNGFILKLDFDGNMLWSKKFNNPNYDNTGILYGITKGGENNFFLTGNIHEDGFRTKNFFILNIDQNGILVKTTILRDTSSFSVIDPASFRRDSFYYFRGYLSHLDSLYNKERGFFFAKLNEELEFHFAKEFISDISNIRLLGTYHNWITTDTTFHIPIYANHETLGPRAGLLALDSALNVIYCKTYSDTTVHNTDAINDLFLNSDGSITVSFVDFYGYYSHDVGANPNESISFAKIDPVGNLLWNRVYGGADRDPYAFVEPTNDAGIMLAGSSFSFDTEGSGIYLLRTDSSGFAGDCYEESYDIITEDLPLTTEPVFFQKDTFPYDLVDFFIPMQSVYPVARDLCCADYADAVVQYFWPAYPCGDSLGVAVSICNSGYIDLPVDFPVAIYDNDPTTGNPTLIDHFILEAPLPPDSCFLFAKTIINVDQAWVVAGDPQAPLPYHLPCDFPLTNTTECDYNNNYRMVNIPDTIDIVPFNDDYFLVCPNSSPYSPYVIDLIVPPYLSNPVWNGLWATDTLTVLVGGTYILEATTPCGNLFIDSILVIEQYPQLIFDFTDTTLCQGDSLIIHSPDPFEAIRWQGLPDSCPGTNTLCEVDTFHTGTLQPGIYYIVGSYTHTWGCGVNDSIAVQILQKIELTFDTTLCAGTNITIQGQSYPAADTTLHFGFSGANGCDSTHIYNLHLADTFYTAINELACPGDTIWHEGQPIAAGETQSFYYQSVLGCDSTLTIQVGLLDTYETEEQQAICPSDSILLFTQWQNQSGFYEQYYTAINGCDSLHIVDLLVYPELNIDFQIQASCPDEATGQIDVQISSGAAPFNFNWSNGISADSSLQQLAAGNYILTITDANACTQVFDFTVPLHTEASYVGVCTPQWYAPTAFSPNGDGINDRYTFYGNERAIRIEQLQIWDRWGNLVFQANDVAFNEEDLGWDGNLKGRAMQPAVFVWKARVLLEGGVSELAYGDLLLMR